jgi:hypothetical protein
LKTLKQLQGALANISSEGDEIASALSSLQEAITLLSQCNVDSTKQAARDLASGVQQQRRLGLLQTQWDASFHKSILEMEVPSTGSMDSVVAPLFGEQMLNRLTEMQKAQERLTSVNKALVKRQAPKPAFNPKPQKFQKTDYISPLSTVPETKVRAQT